MAHLRRTYDAYDCCWHVINDGADAPKHVGNIADDGPSIGWTWEYLKDGKIVETGHEGWQDVAMRRIEEHVDGELHPSVDLLLPKKAQS